MKIKYLIFIPTLFSLFACNKEKLPTRKEGDTCKISFVGEHVTAIDCPSEAPIDQKLSFSLDVEYVSNNDDNPWEKVPQANEDGVLKNPNQDYEISLEDIHVYIGGEEFKNSYQFFYMNNVTNEFTIKKEYMVNDVEINITAKPHGRLYLYGYQFSKTLDDRVDYTNHIDPVRRIGDIEITFSKPYQNFMYEIRTLSGQKAFPVFEHDGIDLTLEVKSNSNVPLPDNIYYRRNARYAMLDVDFTREYSEPITNENGETIGYRKCHLVVPYHAVDDHGSICPYGEK